MSHPFTQAIAARDPDALTAALAPNPVLYSAVTRTPFEGREVVIDTYRSVLESFDELRVVDELEGGDTHAFFWEGEIDGRFVSGADRFRVDADGRVREVTIFGRPMSGVAMFVTDIGFRLARRRRGSPAARILRLTALPLPPILALLDPVTSWVLRGRRR